MSNSGNQPIEIVVLAAGAGTRMNSKNAKVMLALAGKPMLGHVLDMARRFEPIKIHVIYGHRGDQLRAEFSAIDINWVEQAERMGTGHAVRCAAPFLMPNSKTLVLYGDVPALRYEDVLPIVEGCTQNNSLGVLLAELESPEGYGRAIISDGHVRQIVEEKVANDAQRKIKRVNSGLICAQTADLVRWVNALDTNNAQKEYLLTDIFEMAAAELTPAFFSVCRTAWRAFGANDPMQLADLERRTQLANAYSLMAAGVRLADPQRIDVRGNLATGKDVEIDINSIFEGEVFIADSVKIGAFNRIKNCKFAEGTVVHAHCDLDGVVTTGACEIGPFARLRPGTQLQKGAKIGNFVECKNALIGEESKISHLSYIGDAELGTSVNVGAGTITCNYDGVNKHKTCIGDNVFVGSNSSLVAPINIGAGATIGAGSVLTNNAPDNQLTLSRAPQKTIEGWSRPEKAPKS